MHENSKSWNDRIKLAMCELEEKIQRESVHNHRKKNSWPRQEEVDAWTAERQQQKGYGQYCSSAVQENPVTKEERKKQNFIRNICVQVAKSAAFALATVALIQGISRHLPDSITASSSVGGKELPIYSVETDKKQVALSFDAAWGNGWLMESGSVYLYFLTDFRNSRRCSRCSSVSCEISFSNESSIFCKSVLASKNSFREIPNVLQRTSKISTEGLE